MTLCCGHELRPYIEAAVGIVLPENAAFIGDVRDGQVHSVAAFVNWCGHDAYKIGDKVTFEGKRYTSKINGNVWSPTAYQAGWQLVA